MTAIHRPARSLRATAAAILLALAGSVLAAAAIKPLPQPDLSKLPEQARQVLTETRRQFEEARPSLVGLYLAEAYVQMGAIYARYGQLDAARAALENAAAVEPADGRFPYLMGVFSAQAGQLPRARDELKLALSLDDDYLPIRYRLATVQLALGDLAGARAAIESTAKARTDLAPAAALLGEINLREKRWQDAERWYAQALKADPAATALHARRAEALDGLGRKADAEAARRLAGDASPGYPDPLVDGIYAPPPELPTDQALRLAGDGKHAEAAALLDAALKQLPDNPDLLAAYARVEADRGDLAAGQRRADAALKAAPQSAEALLAKGMLLEMESKDADARSRYEAAVRADLKLPAARLALGNAYMRAAQWAPAAEQYRALAALENGAGTADGRLAAALVQGGRCADALKETNATLQRRPRDGGLLQTFVRVAASCPAASDEERRMAADYGEALYKQRPDEGNAEALAMAAAAVGRKDDAVDYQAQAIFEALKRKDDAAVARARTLLERFKAGERASGPWAAGHPMLSPPRLAPSRQRAAG
jgi:lipopolysaccharide biosynthesis regulator YciM